MYFRNRSTTGGLQRRSSDGGGRQSEDCYFFKKRQRITPASFSSSDEESKENLTPIKGKRLTRSMSKNVTAMNPFRSNTGILRETRSSKRREKSIKYDGWNSDSALTPNRMRTRKEYSSSSEQEEEETEGEKKPNKSNENSDVENDSDHSQLDASFYPINMKVDEAKSLLKKKVKNDTAQVIEDVTFDDIFGLDDHIKRLKEIVLFPLIYPDLYKRLGIQPPRGLLFYGPPGTGKTMMVRCLVNMCSKTLGKQVSFFVRKGGDLLSKYVGEAEKNVIQLFDIASKLQPSVIFIDEMDGLTPVRGLKNQDHSQTSLVSTLLALMDGISGRGSKVIVIGATNRLDSIDPALRRPGRFDYEMFFPIPDFNARVNMLESCTKKSGLDSPYKVTSEFLNRLASMLEGCNGSDIKGLCKEAAIRGLRRSCGHLYDIFNCSSNVLKSVAVIESDFLEAFNNGTYGSAKFDLSLPRLKPLSGPEKTFLMPFFEEAINSIGIQISPITEDGMGIHCPRLLLCGIPRNGQDALFSALLFSLRQMNYHMETINMTALCSQSPEIQITHAIRECHRHQPSVICIPDLSFFFNISSSVEQSQQAWNLFVHAINHQLNPQDRVLVIAVWDKSFSKLPIQVQQVFSASFVDRHLSIPLPTDDHRKEFFSHIVENRQGDIEWSVKQTEGYSLYEMQMFALRLFHISKDANDDPEFYVEI